jgi:FMN phosphatase YigB (HAD superfamily)
VLPAAISFDLDGTLAEVRRRRLRLWRAILRDPLILAAFGPEVEALRGQRLPDLDRALITRIAHRCHQDPARVARVLREQIDGAWAQAFAGARPPPALGALLARSDRLGLPRVVVSDHPALPKLRAMGLSGWSAVVSCRALGALKPLPDGLLCAAAQVGVPPGRMLHVGDRDDCDGAMAAAAGARFVSVASLQAGADPLGGA